MIKTCQVYFIVLTILVQITCGLSGQRPSAAPPPEQPPAKSMLQLKMQVDKLLASGDPVMIRRSIEDVLALVDRLVKSGQQDEAFKYLSAALTYDSWALDYQLLFAEMLLTRGQSDLARQRAELVLLYAEKDKQVNRARKLLRQDPLPPFPKITSIPDDRITLVLVPVGEVDVCVLSELQRTLQARLTIPVLLQDARVLVPPPKRDPVTRYLSQLREHLQEEMKKDERLITFFQENGISRDDLEQDAGVVKACRQIAFASGDTEVLTKFDTSLEQLRQAGRQWDIGALLDSLELAVGLFWQPSTYFLGVADLDAFADQSNFIFGTAKTNGHHAIVTYRRFTAEFNDDSPNRKRLVDRLLKQSFSSIGFMLGVPRCSALTCARAYPHSLPEHDAKSTNLCDACRLGFERALGVRLQGDEGPRRTPP